MALTMVADPESRPEVFPTDRLMENGMARPEIRGQLRRIDNGRNAVTVAALWLWVAVIIGGSVWIDRWWAYLAAFVLMGPMYARFAILMHEAAHKLLFTNKRANDWVGTWLVAYPVFTPISLYRRGHFAHHREEFGPREPDMAFYGGYRCDRRSLTRRLVRDAVELSSPARSGAAASLRVGANCLAMTLPSSTPHWSKESMPQMVPSVNTVCS